MHRINKTILQFLFLLITVNSAFCISSDSTSIYKSPYFGLIISSNPIMPNFYEDGVIKMTDQRLNGYPYSCSFGVQLGYAFSIRKFLFRSGVDFISGKEKYSGGNDSIYQEDYFKNGIVSAYFTTSYKLISLNNGNSFSFGLGISLNNKRYFSVKSLIYNHNTANWSEETIKYHFFNHFSFSPFNRKIFISPDLSLSYDAKIYSFPVSIIYIVKFNGASGINKTGWIQTLPIFHQLIFALRFKK